VVIHGSFCLLACSLLLSCVTSCFDKCLYAVLVPEHSMKVHNEVLKSSDPSKPRSCQYAVHCGAELTIMWMKCKPQSHLQIPGLLLF
jgi:hypothetical protein